MTDARMWPAPTARGTLDPAFSVTPSSRSGTNSLFPSQPMVLI
jgi:hypothetical protein